MQKYFGNLIDKFIVIHKGILNALLFSKHEKLSKKMDVYVYFATFSSSILVTTDAKITLNARNACT